MTLANVSLLHQGKPPPGTKLYPMDGGINRSCIGAWLLGEGQRGIIQDSSKLAVNCRVLDNGGGGAFNGGPFAGSLKYGASAYATPRMSGNTANYIGTINNFSPPAGNMTATATFKLYALPAQWAPIMGQWNENGNKRSWIVIVDSTGKLYAYSSSNGTNFREYDVAGAIAANKEYTVSVVFPLSGGTVLIYVNGVAQSTSTSGDQSYSGLFDGGQILYFGHSLKFGGGGAWGVNGIMEAVRIDSRALAADEILFLYQKRFGAWKQVSRRSRYLPHAGAVVTPGSTNRQFPITASIRQSPITASIRQSPIQ